MEKPKLIVVSFSGGKDSTAMLLKMLERGEPVDVILFCDTGLEFPQLYDHIRKVEQQTHRKITTVKSDEGFEYLFARKPITRMRETDTSKKYGLERTGYSWAGPKMRWCTEKLKNQPREQYLRSLREQYEVVECVGIAADETYRLERKCNQRPSVRCRSWNGT